MAENVFAELDENGKEIRRIVVDPEILALGYWGDPDNWTQVEEADEEE